MRLVGKTAPDPDDLEQVQANGFGAVELYLDRSHLETYGETVAACQDSDLEIASIHTPHVWYEPTYLDRDPATAAGTDHAMEDQQYLERSADLAQELDAQLVCHSTYARVTDMQRFATDHPYEDIAFENDYGFSQGLIENLIPDNLVLDTAHLYLSGSDTVYDDIEALSQRAERIHLANVDGVRDGVPFDPEISDGLVLSQTMDAIAASGFDEDVVLEVMPEHQPELKAQIEDWAGVTGYDELEI